VIGQNKEGDFSRKVRQIGEVTYTPSYESEEIRHLKVIILTYSETPKHHPHLTEPHVNNEPQAVIPGPAEQHLDFKQPRKQNRLLRPQNKITDPQLDLNQRRRAHRTVPQLLIAHLNRHLQMQIPHLTRPQKIPIKQARTTKVLSQPQRRFGD
jgi:hypothetical protein